MDADPKVVREILLDGRDVGLGQTDMLPDCDRLRIGGRRRRKPPAPTRSSSPRWWCVALLLQIVHLPRQRVQSLFLVRTSGGGGGCGRGDDMVMASVMSGGCCGGRISAHALALHSNPISAMPAIRRTQPTPDAYSFYSLSPPSEMRDPSPRLSLPTRSGLR